MSDVANDVSLADLEKLISQRKGHLKQLERRRERLQSQLEEVESEIASIVGERSAGGSVRAVNKQSLHEVVCETLGRYKKGLALADLQDAVLATGYKTNSKNFKNVLYQCVYNSESIAHDANTGKYLLA